MLEIHAIRREDLLTAFSLSADLLLRSRLYAFAERKVLLKRNTLGEAVNRRNEKKAFSEAASFFPFRLLLWGLKGASSPFLVDPARRNRWWFSGSLLTSKENISLNEKALCPAHQRANLLKEKTSPALWPARSASLYRFATAISARFSSRIRSSTVFTAVSTSAFGMRAMSTAHA